MRRRLVWLGAVLLIAGCSKTSPNVSASSPVSRSAVASVESPTGAVPVSPLPWSPSVVIPGHSWKSFQMPSHNIGCMAYGKQLRCDILSGMNPEPSGSCPLDWTGLIITAGGEAKPSCAGDTAYDPSEPVLAYGETWGRNGITCESKTSGLVCSNTAGHGFTLAREAWTVH